MFFLTGNKVTVTQRQEHKILGSWIKKQAPIVGIVWKREELGNSARHGLSSWYSLVVILIITIIGTVRLNIAY